MLGPDRMKPVNDQLRNHLAVAVLQEVELPEGMIVSITKVKTAPDLHHADVLVSVIPDNQAGTALTLLKKNLGKISQNVAAKISMHRMPKLHLKVDDQERSANRIEELLDSLQHEE